VPAPEYGNMQSYQAGNSVPIVLDGTTAGSIPVSDLLP